MMIGVVSASERIISLSTLISISPDAMSGLADFLSTTTPTTEITNSLLSEFAFS